jgi:transposase
MIVKCKNNCTVNPVDYDIFVGLDVDKRSIALTAVDHYGMEKSTKMPYNADNLLHYVSRRYQEKRVLIAYEAGPTGYGLYDRIKAASYECLVVSPSATPRAASERVKTNRIDSRKLAYLLRGGQLHGIHVPSLLYRRLRHLVQLREVFVRHSRADKFRIKGLLLLEGIAFPEPSPRARWSAAIVKQLKELVCECTLRLKLDHLIASLEFSDQHLASINRSLQDFCAAEPELNRCMELLQSIPGIGPTVGVYLLSRIGDWRQMDSPRGIAGLLGLIPVENSTGDHTRRGSISRLGDAATRNKLIEAAWTTIRIDQELHQFYERIKGRHPAQVAARKAIVAVARKLTTRIYAVLRHQRPYYRKEMK